MLQRETRSPGDKGASQKIHPLLCNKQTTDEMLFESCRSLRLFINNHRPAELFEELFWKLSDHFRSTNFMGHRKKKFRFQNKLLSFDSTTISLCLSLFPWAEFRRAKGGEKVHVRAGS